MIKSQFNYNHFTIDYIEAIKVNLNIEIDSFGNAIFIPNKITEKNLIALQNELSNIWNRRETAIDLLRNKHGSLIQTGLFGMVNDLETAIRIGFLLGDRVVLIDYIFERILSKKRLDKINKLHLGVIASSLVSALPLAYTGRVVIIPNPFNWNLDSKKIISDVAKNIDLNMDVIEFLNILSIVKTCNLLPYTIAESNNQYEQLITICSEKNISDKSIYAKDISQNIITALLSEKLIENIEFYFLKKIPLSKYQSIISKFTEFYSSFSELIRQGGLLNEKLSIMNLKNKILIEINQKNNLFSSDEIRKISAAFGISGGLISIVGNIFHLPAYFTISGAIMALSNTIIKALKASNGNINPIISVFYELKKSI